MRALACGLMLVSAITFAEPPPTTTRYLDVVLRWSRGQITVEKVEPGRFDKPTLLKRFVGRFEARATARGKAVDSVRFDFPLLGDADVGVERAMDQRIKSGLSTVVKVRVPVDGADAVAIVDTHDRKAVAVAVPVPVAGPVSGAGPAGGGRPPR